MQSMKKILVSALVMFAWVGVRAQVTSVYTDLIDTKCKTIELNENEGGWYKGLCPGIAGYKLELIEGDLRQTINIIDPKGTTHELHFWKLTGAFSAVGEKAEWRMKGKRPIALIVRLNVSEHQDDGTSRNKGYLVVAKITPQAICVTHFLAPTRSHNFEARRAADKSASRPCRFESTPD